MTEDVKKIQDKIDAKFDSMMTKPDKIDNQIQFLTKVWIAISIFSFFNMCLLIVTR